MPKWLPTGPEILREAIIVLAGAALAYAVVSILPPEVKKVFMLPGSQN